MTTKIAYVVELTEDEAIALAVLSRSGVQVSDGWVSQRLTAIGEALLEAGGDKLRDQQFALWKRLEDPGMSIGGDASLK